MNIVFYNRSRAVTGDYNLEKSQYMDRVIFILKIVIITLSNGILDEL